jgi:hypothetical protein
MLKAIGLMQNINRYSPKRPKRVAPIEFIADTSNYKGQRKPRDCCKAQWEDMPEIARYRKTRLVKCPVCGIHYEVYYRLNEVCT